MNKCEMCNGDVVISESGKYKCEHCGYEGSIPLNGLLSVLKSSGMAFENEDARESYLMVKELYNKSHFDNSEDKLKPKRKNRKSSGLMRILSDLVDWLNKQAGVEDVKTSNDKMLPLSDIFYDNEDAKYQ